MPVAAPPTRKHRWYVNVGSKVYGPYDEPTIARMVERGQIMSNDLVVREGTSEWIEGAKEPLLNLVFKSKLAASAFAEPPVDRGRRWSGKLIFLGVSIIIVAWIVWPYFAALSLWQAVRDGDVSTLERRVDWNSLRQSLKGDLNARLLQKQAGDGAAGGFATLLGPAVINQIIDGYVTPQAIAALRRPKGDAPNDNNDTLKITKSIGLVRQVNWDQIRYAFFSGNPFAFEVDVLPPSDPPVQNPARLEFSWSGDWRLVRVRLPSEVFSAKDRPPTPLVLDSPSRAVIDTSADSAKVVAAETAAPPRVEEPPPVTISLLSKRFRPSDLQAGNYQSALLLDLTITNQASKAIRAFDGILTITDLLDNDIFSAKLAINQSLGIASSLKWAASIDYNQFKSEHRELRNQDQSNLKTKFVIRKVLFADGSTKEYP
jgi:hypothetical protein